MVKRLERKNPLVPPHPFAVLKTPIISLHIKTLFFFDCQIMHTLKVPFELELIGTF